MNVHSEKLLLSCRWNKWLCLYMRMYVCNVYGISVLKYCLHASYRRNTNQVAYFEKSATSFGTFNVNTLGKPLYRRGGRPVPGGLLGWLRGAGRPGWYHAARTAIITLLTCGGAPPSVAGAAPALVAGAAALSGATGAWTKIESVSSVTGSSIEKLGIDHSGGPTPRLDTIQP